MYNNTGMIPDYDLETKMEPVAVLNRTIAESKTLLEDTIIA